MYGLQGRAVSSSNLIFVDCEADAPCPARGHLTEVGAVQYGTRATFHGDLRSPVDFADYQRAFYAVFVAFDEWLKGNVKGRPIFVSDNPAFDWQWVNDGFWRTIGRNPFGHSARRISDFYAGLRGDFSKTQQWKGLRVTPHDHNPVNDAMGNLEAFERLLKGER